MATLQFFPRSQAIEEAMFLSTDAASWAAYNAVRVQAPEPIALLAPGTAPESLVTAAAPLASPVTIRIGGVSASVAYAGQTGSGLYQFNVVVPQLPTGDQRVDAEITGIAVTAAMYLTVQ